MSAAAPGPERGAAASDSLFEASAFERSLKSRAPRRWMSWHRRALALAALLGCLGLFSLARWLATTPHIDAEWSAGPAGELLLQGSRVPALAAHTGRALRGLGLETGPQQPVDALLLHRWPRWQVDDALRARQVAQHEAVAQLLEAAPGKLQLHFADGSVVEAPVKARGYAGLGMAFWPLAGLALLLYLFAVVLVLARPRRRTALFVLMALCQAGNAVLMAAAAGGGLGTPVGMMAGDLPWRMALDLCTGAAGLQLYALHPRRLAHAVLLSTAGWMLPLLWVALAFGAYGGDAMPLWWPAQGACLLLAVTALAVAGHSHRVEPNPYALVMMRLAGSALAGFSIITLVALAASMRLAAPPSPASRPACGTWWPPSCCC